jgi:glutathione S-transferase
MSDVITLYINPMTANNIKIQLLVNALNVPAHYEHVVLHKPQEKSADFLHINPAGKVPVLKDEDLVLTESNAILKYLAHKHQSPLWPSDATLQAQVLKWMFFQTGGWNKTVGVFSHRRVVLPHWGFDQQQVLSPQQLQDFHVLMEGFNNELAGKNTLMGTDISIADICLGSYLMFAQESQMPLESFVNVRRWLTHLQQTLWWQETHLSLRHILNSSESCSI